ncbi:MAG: polysaccharide biosynthesis C-terminal domain-containing protein [Ginsengibacter sp.]
MNFKRELIKNIFFKVINVFLSFVITVLMVRLLGVDGNGIYSLFIANTAIVVLIISFSFNSGITYYSAKNEFASTALLNSAFVILLLQVVLVLIAEKIFSSIFGFSFYVDIQFPQLSFWGCIYLSSVLFNGYLSAIFTGNKWFDSLNSLTVIINVLFVIVFSYLLFSNKSNSLAHTLLILKTYIVLVALQTLLNLIVLLKKIRYRFKFSFLKLKQFKLVFMYAGIAFFSNLFQFLAYRMDYWFINYFNNKEELGLYALASKLNQVLWLLPMTIAAVIIPFTVTASEKLLDNLKTIIRLQFNAYILLGIVLAVLSPIFIPIIFTNAFSGTVLPFIILLPGVIIFTLTTILAAYFAGSNRQDINLKISFFCFFTILVGDIILVPRFGKEGAAVASSIGYAISGFCSLYVFSKQSGSSFKKLLWVQKQDFSRVKNVLSRKLLKDE